VARRSLGIARPGVCLTPLPILLAFLGSHVVLGVAMKSFPLLATVHALITLLAACCLAASPLPAKVVPAVCYLAGAEVLWRMSGASVFWEFGKYAVCVVLLVWLFRHRSRRLSGLPLLYFGLLLPSTVLAILALPDWHQLRMNISSSLSGPLALALCAFCFSRSRISKKEAHRSLLGVLGPMAGVAAVCTLGIASLGSGYEFGNESNSDASGGFGPNQVSSVLGMGMLAGFLWMQGQRRLSSRWWLGAALVLWFAAQAALTFSRSGVWIGLTTIATASLFLMRQRGRLVSGLLGGLLVFGLFYFLFQSLNDFTGGKLAARYAEKGFSNRENIARGDLLLALKHPVLGVGTGMLKTQRNSELGIHGAAHTEFTRLLAEHGLSGLLAPAALFWMTLQAFRASSDPLQQAWSASLLAYSLLFMMVSGMRLVAPAVAIGLVMVKLTGAKGIYAKRCRGNSPPSSLPTGHSLTT
jgi:hypothetical protein